jgi:hypothetical protein
MHSGSCLQAAHMPVLALLLTIRNLADLRTFHRFPAAGNASFGRERRVSNRREPGKRGAMRAQA